MTQEARDSVAVRAKLLVKRGQNAGLVYELDESKDWVIGRDTNCTLQFVDKGLSRNHSKIAVEDGGFVVSDLGSTNGTFVNGKMIIRRPLINGDVIKVGKIELQFLEHQPTGMSSSVVRFVDDQVTTGAQTIARRVDIDSVTLRPSFEKERDRARHVEHLQKTLRMIYQLGRSMNRASDRDSLFESVMDVIDSVLQPERVFVVFPTEDGAGLEPVASRSRRGGEQEFRVSRTIVHQCISEKQSILSRNAMLDDRFSGGMSIISQNIQSVMCAPLESQDRVFGAIYLDSQGASDLFKQGDLDLLSMMGQQAGAALERIELTQHLIEKQKIEQSLAVAQGIQQNFLPRAVPESVLIDIVGWNKACDETGGDYYDFIEIGPRHLGLAIADVSGHGVGAALIMATARAFLRALAREDTPLPDLMNRLNVLLAQDLEDHQFVTFFYGVLDLESYHFRYCSAGHDAPLVYRRATAEFEQLDSTGIPLGMLPDFVYEEERSVDFGLGDLLVMATDGIVEAMNDENEEFGRDRFTAAIADSNQGSSNQIVNTVFERMRGFCGESSQRDDLTLVVARFVETKERPSGDRPQTQPQMQMGPEGTEVQRGDTSLGLGEGGDLGTTWSD